jgi:hypothetical protein
MFHKYFTLFDNILFTRVINLQVRNLLNQHREKRVLQNLKPQTTHIIMNL